MKGEVFSYQVEGAANTGAAVKENANSKRVNQLTELAKNVISAYKTASALVISLAAYIGEDGGIYFHSKVITMQDLVTVVSLIAERFINWEREPRFSIGGKVEKGLLKMLVDEVFNFYEFNGKIVSRGIYLWSDKQLQNKYPDRVYLIKVEDKQIVNTAFAIRYIFIQMLEKLQEYIKEGNKPLNELLVMISVTNLIGQLHNNFVKYFMFPQLQRRIGRALKIKIGLEKYVVKEGYLNEIYYDKDIRKVIILDTENQAVIANPA